MLTNELEHYRMEQPWGQNIPNYRYYYRSIPACTTNDLSPLPVNELPHRKVKNEDNTAQLCKCKKTSKGIVSKCRQRKAGNAEAQTTNIKQRGTIPRYKPCKLLLSNSGCLPNLCISNLAKPFYGWSLSCCCPSKHIHLAMNIFPDRVCSSSLWFGPTLTGPNFGNA